MATGSATDHFSGHAPDYARFRPNYPDALFDWLAAHTAGHDLAWDVGCGNGQASLPLAAHYARVVATDLSTEQIAQAPAHPRVTFRAAPSHDSGVADASCDLITIAQALHWFDFDAFYTEVRRVLKPGGLIAAWTYQLLRSEPAIDDVLEDFYRRELGPYWPPERRWVDLGYQGMAFPFAEIAAPAMEIRLQWSLADLVAYLGTWSATQRYRIVEQQDPIPSLAQRLLPVWGAAESSRLIIWPIALRVGRA
ncbi:MAG: class I SAM-dependent methyltransferase [Rhodocyclaceae bacterium]|nr:class I SAM-dependent methyltransferase [Rhodocyclaceae bacterium]